MKPGVAVSDETEDSITNQGSDINGYQNGGFYYDSWFASGFELFL